MHVRLKINRSLHSQKCLIHVHVYGHESADTKRKERARYFFPICDDRKYFLTVTSYARSSRARLGVALERTSAVSGCVVEIRHIFY